MAAGSFTDRGAAQDFIHHEIRPLIVATRALLDDIDAGIAARKAHGRRLQ
jgi:hypothetical protein